MSALFEFDLKNIYVCIQNKASDRKHQKDFHQLEDFRPLHALFMLPKPKTIEGDEETPKKY